MKKNKKILILDDTYGHYFYKKISQTNKGYSFHVRGNIIDPIKYYKYIVKTKPDIIIMNTWYKNNNYSSSKGISLLERILGFFGKNKEEYDTTFFGLIKTNKHTELKISGFNSKIIYVCDMGKHNLSKFSIFKYFVNNIYFVPDKNIQKIIEIIESN